MYIFSLFFHIYSFDFFTKNGYKFKIPYITLLNLSTLKIYNPNLFPRFNKLPDSISDATYACYMSEPDDYCDAIILNKLLNSELDHHVFKYWKKSAESGNENSLFLYNIFGKILNYTEKENNTLLEDVLDWNYTSSIIGILSVANYIKKNHPKEAFNKIKKVAHVLFKMYLFDHLRCLETLEKHDFVYPLYKQGKDKQRLIEQEALTNESFNHLDRCFYCDIVHYPPILDYFQYLAQKSDSNTESNILKILIDMRFNENSEYTLTDLLNACEASQYENAKIIKASSYIFSSQFSQTNDFINHDHKINHTTQNLNIKLVNAMQTLVNYATLGNIRAMEIVLYGYLTGMEPFECNRNKAKVLFSIYQDVLNPIVVGFFKSILFQEFLLTETNYTYRNAYNDLSNFINSYWINNFGYFASESLSSKFFSNSKIYNYSLFLYQILSFCGDGNAMENAYFLMKINNMKNENFLKYLIQNDKNQFLHELYPNTTVKIAMKDPHAGFSLAWKLSLTNLSLSLELLNNIVKINSDTAIPILFSKFFITIIYYAYSFITKPINSILSCFLYFRKELFFFSSLFISFYFLLRLRIIVFCK